MRVTLTTVASLLACLLLVGGCEDKKGSETGGEATATAKASAKAEGEKAEGDKAAEGDTKHAAFLECNKKYSTADGADGCKKCCEDAGAKGNKHVGGDSAKCQCYVPPDGWVPK